MTNNIFYDIHSEWECLRCKSEKIVKNGHRADGKQSYKYQACGYQFASERITTESIKFQAVRLYCAGLSFRTIGVLLGYANAMVSIWVREYLPKHITTS